MQTDQKLGSLKDIGIEWMVQLANGTPGSEIGVFARLILNHGNTKVH